MEGGRYGTRPVFPRALAPRTALALHAPVLAVATESTHTSQADQDTVQRLEALAGAHAQALL
jgi:hypothetical protein